MVKLNIEMTMADLIGKIAKKQERLPTYHSSFNRRPGGIGSRMPSFGNSFTTSFASRNNTVQPPPPARNAVPFRAWQGSSVSAGGGMDSVAVSYRGSISAPANRDELTFVTVPDDPIWNNAGITSPDGPNNNTSDTAMELYMVKEVTVQSDVVRRSTCAANGSEDCMENNNWGRGSPSPSFGRERLYDTPVGSGRKTPPPVIWDGTPQISTTIATGVKND
jgi:hypothetical protein